MQSSFPQGQKIQNIGKMELFIDLICIFIWLGIGCFIEIVLEKEEREN
jgi:hypothetical protein